MYGHVVLLTEITYLAGKVFIHRWPRDSPAWDGKLKARIDSEINKSPKKKRIIVSAKTVSIDGHEFSAICKVGISVPMFQRQSTMIFEGRCGDLCAHVHITTSEDGYLGVCKELSAWRDEFFPESIDG